VKGMTARRALVALAVSLTCVCAISVPALAKGPELHLREGGPIDVRPGEPWHPRVTLVDYPPRRIARARPQLTIRNPRGERRIFPGRPTNGRDTYRFRVVFPGPGHWSYAVDDGLRGPPTDYYSGPYQFRSEAVVLSGPRLQPEPPASPGASNGAWLAALGGAALFLTAAGLALVWWRHRGAPSATA